jgi:uncharacterized membrane protein
MGAQLPVCARCTGIYAGAALGSCLAAVRVMALRFSAAKRGSLNPRLVRMLLFAAAAPTAITWLVEVLGLARLDNLARAAAAVPFGISVAWLATVAGAGPTADASLR